MAPGDGVDAGIPDTIVRARLCLDWGIWMLAWKSLASSDLEGSIAEESIAESSPDNRTSRCLIG